MNKIQIEKGNLLTLRKLPLKSLRYFFILVFEFT